MASTAYAFDWGNEVHERAAAPVATVERARPTGSWHHLQAERLAAAFGEEQVVRPVERLPLSARASILIAGALLGWAVPIAVVASIAR